MKNCLISLIGLLLVTSASAETKLSPEPTPLVIGPDNMLSWVLPDENYSEYHTPESTIEEFNRLVAECITTEGEINEDTVDLNIALIDFFIPRMLAEHFNLRGQDVAALIKQFGPPTRIQTVRKDIDRGSHEWFMSEIPESIGWGLAVHGDDIWFEQRAPFVCYEYDDFFIWVVGREPNAKIADKVLAISPRSFLYDQYIYNLNIFEQEDD